jgi:hypothetical protein
LLGFFLHTEWDLAKPLAVCMVVLCAIVSGYGLYQYFWGFEQLYNYVTHAGSDQVVKVPILERIATRRVFFNVSSPRNALGISDDCLAISRSTLANQSHGQDPAFCQRLDATGYWPAHAVVWFSCGIVCADCRMALSSSSPFGLAACSHCHLTRPRWRSILFITSRRNRIRQPLILRAKNWITAWTIFAAHPMGIGLNNYGVVYSQYMLPGANETQYTHNTPLQLLSELGIRW